MINFKLPLSLVLLTVVSLSACSSNTDTLKADQQTVLFEDTISEIDSAVSTSTALVANPLLDSATAIDIQYLRIKNYQVECEGFHVGHCLLTQNEGSDDWVYFYEQIEGFNYEWGNDYEILVQVEKRESGLADVSDQRYSLVEVISKSAYVSEQGFQYTAHHTDERIIETAPGLYSLLGNKEFTCTAASCDTIKSAIAQNQSAVLLFQHSTVPNEPLVLDAVLCSDSKSSFSESCL